MDLMSLIETRAGVRSGKPCFIGTRIAVYDVLDYLASGMTSSEIVDDFPELSEDHVRAGDRLRRYAGAPPGHPGVKLLFDQNLSRHLVHKLADEFADSRHVTEVGLDAATDNEIWSYAGEHGFVIVSKDSDFRQLAFLNGPPPKANWLRMGNASTNQILAALTEHKSVIQVFSESEDEALLVIEPTKSPDL